MHYGPHKYWAVSGAEGIRTPDPLDAKEVATVTPERITTGTPRSSAAAMSRTSSAIAHARRRSNAWLRPGLPSRVGQIAARSTA